MVFENSIDETLFGNTKIKRALKSILEGSNLKAEFPKLFALCLKKSKRDKEDDFDEDDK